MVSIRAHQVRRANRLVMERTERVAIEETPGHVNVWIYNGRGDTSTALLAEVNHKMEGYWEEATGQ